MKRLISRFIPIVAIVLSGCIHPAVYDENMDITQNKWNADALATFSVNITDTVSVHHVYISVRNTTDYPYSNLYLFVETHAPSGAMLRDTVEYFLAHDNGQWVGKGFGALRDNQFPYKRYIRFPESGIYTFSLQQGMRTQNLAGIASVGIRIEKDKK